jgi:hypothetical protein
MTSTSTTPGARPLRYAETGSGFTRSDNSHLMALAEHDPDELDHQVRWTADLLSECGMPRLLAAAVADEHDGLRHAVTRVHEWAGDPRRFGRRWIDAVDRTIAHGRRL